MRHSKPAVSLLKRQVLDYSRAPKLRRHRENMVQLTGKDFCVSVCGVGYSCCDEELVTETGQMVRQSHGSFYIGWKTGGGRVPRAEQIGVVKPDAEESAYR